ncbi:adenosine deaminase [Legionella birminghamensis]|uniref:adenosine deaminase n=1 Tax=Legionella birminghamensis TaxID=28083 RepID=A0A378ID97_9GAMM|nr:adenosine deaminase [Legionella birminghamensis]KTC75479.1 adenosine deaminase [Legionella birminghamensis]STX32705.1 adenosine deaminase [Legionella birminghamensis]
MQRLISCALLLGLATSAQSSVEQVFDQVRQDPNALYAFLKEMPKGGELHYHLSGGAYPETMVKLASEQDYCLDLQTLSVAKITETCKGIKTSHIFKNPELYDQIIRSWSMKNFIAGKESGHDHFFATFFKFTNLVMDNHIPLLAEVIQRAADQQEEYIEVMMMPDYARSTLAAPAPDLSQGYEKAKTQLLANPAFMQEISNTVKVSDQLLPDTRKFLGCENKPEQAACLLTVKLQYHILREQELPQFFMQALHGFAAASQSTAIVAINVVQAEDGIISLRDYKKQMEVIHFLHQLYPQVHIALHAGELSGEDVMPEDLRFHIRDALLIGHAERIGHGLDIGFEDNSLDTLNYMKTRQIPVEINLTSNEKILNITGKEHPIHYYLAHDVPVVLSTDDEGVLRTDLTRQYVKAVIEHDIDYSQLKNMTRNVLTYAFLPGKSLWADPAKGTLVNECMDLNSAACEAFVKRSEKAHLQRDLELKLAAFEKRFES